MESTISVIFPSYNGENFIKRNLESLENLRDKNIEIIIIDNNSNDSTLKIIKSFQNSLNIKLESRKKNLGYAKAINIGVKKSKSDYLFITNQDMVFTPNFFEELLNIYQDLKKEKEIILSPAIVFEEGGIHYYGAKIHYLGFSYTQNLGKKLPKTKLLKKTQRFSGGSLFLKSNLYHKIGGFDEKLFMYCEDTDLSLKMIRNKIAIYTTNYPYLIHQHHKWELNNFRYYLLERNRFIVFCKNINNFKKLIPIFIIIEMILLFHAILIKKFNLRIRIYYELFRNCKLLKKLRYESRLKTELISHKNLSKTLDLFFLKQFRYKRITDNLINILNNLLKKV